MFEFHPHPRQQSGKKIWVQSDELGPFVLIDEFGTRGCRGQDTFNVVPLTELERQWPRVYHALFTVYTSTGYQTNQTQCCIQFSKSSKQYQPLCVKAHRCTKGKPGLLAKALYLVLIDTTPSQHLPQLSDHPQNAKLQTHTSTRFPTAPRSAHSSLRPLQNVRETHALQSRRMDRLQSKQVRQVRHHHQRVANAPYKHNGC